MSFERGDLVTHKEGGGLGVITNVHAETVLQAKQQEREKWEAQAEVYRTVCNRVDTEIRIAKG